MKNLITVLSISFLLMSLNGSLLAQQRIKLNDVSKFELVTRGYIFSSYYKMIEVVREGNRWNCYQTKLRKRWVTANIVDSSRVFIRSVPSETLNQLLKLIARPDTLNINLFNISKEGLIKAIHTVNPYLSPAQRGELIRAMGSKDTLQRAFKRAINPFMKDDATYYGITVTTKRKTTLTIGANSFLGDCYYLPWSINDVKSYNPDITNIFEFISGNDKFAEQQKQWLYSTIDKIIYQDYF